MGERLGRAMRRVIGALQRPVLVVCLLLVTAYATVGFLRQEQTVHRLTDEVAQRQQEHDDVLHEQQILTAEIAALNDPARYSQYATLVARHTLLLTRPDETLIVVNWQAPSGQPTPPRATDWKALLRAANIPNP
jgi:cell division protein FtsB